jgi:hypothetical protein
MKNALACPRAASSAKGALALLRAIFALLPADVPSSLRLTLAR